jgi:hypothetical protein
MKLFRTSYYQLISSLPPLPSRLEQNRLLISRERLQERLRMLEPEDYAEVERMNDIISWSLRFEERDDLAVVRKYDALMQNIVNPLVREVLTALLDVQMIVTALRRRRRGLGPPPVGMGRWFSHIRRRFNEPDFGLGHVYPGIARIGPLLEQGDILNTHRGLVEAAWLYLKRRADDAISASRPLCCTSRDGTFCGSGRRWSPSEAGRSLKPL